MRDEPIINIDYPMELTKFTLGGGCREIADGLHILLQGANACAVDVVTEELQLGSTKHTLGWVDEDTVVIQPFQYKV